MSKFIKLLLVFIFFFSFTIGSMLFFAYKDLPDTNHLKSCFKTSMNKVYLCEKNPNYVKLTDISLHLREAILISEDVSFYNHNGFDSFEIKQSFITNLLKLKYARGASTISQQLAKNIYLKPEKSILRKLREILITIDLEEKYSKDTLFEKYLNVVQFGENLYGIKDASEFYFSKHPSELSIIESAFLAYLLPSPVKYSKIFFKKQLTDFSKKIMSDIIYKMHFFKKITDSEYEASKNELPTLFQSEDIDSDLL